MTSCEICGKEVSRRKRHIPTNKLTCWYCHYRLRNPVDTAREVARLEKKIEDYRRERLILPTGTKYKYNSPYSAIPPIDVLQRSILALDLSHIYTEFSTVLGDYYGFKAPRYLTSPEDVPKGAIACYHNYRNLVYATKKPMSRHTAFHEFWHALENHGLVPRTIDSEKNANEYARACILRLKGNGGDV